MLEKVLDENFVKIETAEDDTTDWYEVTPGSFDLYGLIEPEEDGILSRRMPHKVAQTVDESVIFQSTFGAGGRVLFSTDSPYIALKVEYGGGSVATVNNHCLTYGFDLYRYEDGKDIYVTVFRPVKFDYQTLDIKQLTYRGGQMTCYTLNLPCFAAVKRLQLGLEKGSRIGRGKRYRNDKPVVFYGSSITHGAAASHPGNTYESFISQRYNLDYRNLGFAGRAKGEQTVADFMADLPMCLFVSDYDFNAPSVEHLEKTHYRLYETIRAKHPDIPYIMISHPVTFPRTAEPCPRRAVIWESYQRAKAAGDENVYFIDGETLFDGEHKEACTADNTHPNDLGFYRMSRVIGDVIAKALIIEA